MKRLWKSLTKTFYSSERETTIEIPAPPKLEETEVEKAVRLAGELLDYMDDNGLSTKGVSGEHRFITIYHNTSESPGTGQRITITSNSMKRDVKEIYTKRNGEIAVYTKNAPN